ncbi:MAG TPA: hypothetical protein VGF48_26135 [Thermoanaerobaculia bacterium]|jgi:hypothetical protein
MYLIYNAHSYREPDKDLNTFFRELMVSEDMTPSVDPQSDRLNAAKPERHLRSCDGMVAVVPFRDPPPSPSPYILFEIEIAIRARKPVLVFVEDVLPSNLLPRGVLQRRFSRRGLLRQAREHRHALRLLKSYLGPEPAPPYEPSVDRRTCLLIGRSALDEEQFACVHDYLGRRQYDVIPAPQGADCLSYDHPPEALVGKSMLCVSFAEGLSPLEFYILGATRAVVMPLIVLTRNLEYPFNERVPNEYQPKIVESGDGDAVCSVLETEVDIFEEDYLELKDQTDVLRYRTAVMTPRDTRESRARVINNIMNQRGGTIDMSQDNVNISNVGGVVNFKSRLEHVTNTITNASSLAADKRTELAALIRELQEALAKAPEARSEDAAQVTRAAEMVAAEVAKEKPSKGMLRISAEGLKEAAQAVADIAPSIIGVAGKIATFIAAML